MTAVSLILVLLAAVAHASWNLLLKRADDPVVVKLGGVEWQGIEKGLADVRQRYKPALVWYSGSSGKADLGLLKRLESSSLIFTAFSVISSWVSLEPPTSAKLSPCVIRL